MAALGGADQPELAEQIQLLREQNNLLVQQNLQLQQGRPAARVQPQPERRRFLEPPTEADLDEQRLYLIPATLTRGPNSHRLPTDVAGAQGEPHLLNLTSEYIYLHAVEKGKKHDSTVLRILLSLLSYLEVLEFGLSAARAQAVGPMKPEKQRGAVACPRRVDEGPARGDTRRDQSHQDSRGAGWIPGGKPSIPQRSEKPGKGRN
ncbi:hypothetical protein NFJ02_16g25220 [Pycnococcus provasolii]